MYRSGNEGCDLFMDYLYKHSLMSTNREEFFIKTNEKADGEIV
jgi:hypothetical protein